MFSSRAPIGYVAISRVEAATNQGFKSVIPSGTVFNEYLYFYLKASKQLAEERATGTTFKEISGSAFSILPVPLPPLAEQHRIVAKIEALFSELDAGEDSLKRARAQLGLYRQSLLKAAFQGHLTADWRAANPDKLEIPEALLSRIRKEREARHKQALDDWQTALSEWRAGGEVGRKPAKPERPAELTHSKYGYKDLPDGWLWVSVEGLLALPLINGRSVKDRAGGFPVLRLSAFRNGVLDLAEQKEGDWTAEEAESWVVKEGDFFAARGNGSKHLVGIGALARNVSSTVAFPDTMIRLVLDTLVVRHDYFAQVWNSRVMRNQIEAAARTTAGIYKINQPHICGFGFPLPPFAEQAIIMERIAPALSQVDHQEAEITTALAKIAALRQAILKKAFSGSLVPQDPADEPASALLAQIRAKPSAQKSRPPRRKAPVHE